MTVNRPLTQWQLDGLACVDCGRNDIDFLASSVPAGTLGAHQLFRCQQCGEKAKHRAVLQTKTILADLRSPDGK